VEPRHLDLRGPRARDTARPADDEFRDGVAQLTAAITGRSKAEIPGEDVRQHRGTVRFSLGISADGARLIGGRSDGGVVVVDLASGAEIARLTGLSKNVTAVALSSDGRLAAAGDFAGTGFRTAVI
jgi:hypothetical protein